MELFEALVLTVSVLAGWVGGSTGLICGHPLDTVKVVQQAGSRASMLQVASPCTTEHTECLRHPAGGGLHPQDRGRGRLLQGDALPRPYCWGHQLCALWGVRGVHG